MPLRVFNEKEPIASSLESPLPHNRFAVAALLALTFVSGACASRRSSSRETPCQGVSAMICDDLNRSKPDGGSSSSELAK
jgi:hypothetical protein